MEWICWATTFGLLGSSIQDLVQMSCTDAAGADAKSFTQLIETLAFAVNLIGNGVALLLFTVIDLKRLLVG